MVGVDLCGGRPADRPSQTIAVRSSRRYAAAWRGHLVDAWAGAWAGAWGSEGADLPGVRPYYWGFESRGRQPERHRIQGWSSES